MIRFLLPTALIASLTLSVLLPTPVSADGILVAIAATPSNDGTLRLRVGGDAGFALAVVNVGDATVRFMPLLDFKSALRVTPPYPMTC